LQRRGDEPEVVDPLPPGRRQFEHGQADQQGGEPEDPAAGGGEDAATLSSKPFGARRARTCTRAERKRMPKLRQR